MPFIKSASDSARAKNIREALDSYKRKGTFSGRKLSPAEARKQIVAAAYSAQREAKK